MTDKTQEELEEIWNIVKKDSLASSRIGYPSNDTRQKLQAYINKNYEVKTMVLEIKHHENEIDEILNKFVGYYPKDSSGNTLKTEAKHSLELLIEDRVRSAVNRYIETVYDYYPTDVFPKPTDKDYKKVNDWDANLHTRLHCDGIRHGLTLLKRAMDEELEEPALQTDNKKEGV